METLGEYFYVIILIIGALAQWLRSHKESKEAAEEEKRGEAFSGEDEAYFDLEEELESAPRPAVPPPLTYDSMPGAERSAVPDLRQVGREAPAVESATELHSRAFQAELDRQAAMAEKLAALKQEAKTRRGASAAARKIKRQQQSANVPVFSAGSGLKQSLHSRAEIKKAFVLKEILERPVGLR